VDNHIIEEGHEGVKALLSGGSEQGGCVMVWSWRCVVVLWSCFCGVVTVSEVGWDEAGELTIIK